MSIEFQNRQASFNYFIEDKIMGGIVLVGSEVKSLRQGKLSFNDSFCQIIDNEIWLKGLYIGEYSNATSFGHIPVSDRKLLLTKKEIKKITLKFAEKGYSIFPIKIFFNEKNIVKILIGIGKGKKSFDKRNSIKEKEVEKNILRKYKL